METKKFLVGLVVLVSVASMAQAAPPPAATWTGFYVGINGGSARVESNWTDVDYDWYGGTLTQPFNATIWGLTAGYNKQVGNIVYGLEFDYSTSGKKNEVVYDGYYYYDQAIPDVLKTDELKELMTLRARVGIPVDRALFYFTAGLSKPKVEHTWTEANDENDSWATFTNNKVGWAVGAGFEHKIGTNFSWKFEYLVAKNTAETATNPNDYKMEVDESLNIFRLGLNYKFGK